jgi:SAM-dependent methyltransferase
LPEALPACPWCGGAGRPAFERHGHAIVDCSACAHRYAGLRPGRDHAAQVYGDAYFFGGGAGYADYLSGGALLRASGRRYGDIAARYARPGRVLDVGAAAGFVLQGLGDAGWRGIGLEPNVAMVQHGRRALGLDLRAGTAEDLRPGETFDLVSMVQVVAHFADPQRAFARLAEATRPGGLWLIETWDWRSWTARLAGPGWHEYSPPSVLHWYTRGTLAVQLKRYGFEPVAHGRPVKRLLGAHARSLLDYKLRASRLGRLLTPALRLLPDDAVLPYPAEDLFWLLARKG